MNTSCAGSCVGSYVGRAETSVNDLVARFAERYGFGEDELLNTLAQTAFRQQNGTVPTREQMLSLLAVADCYGLNPFIKQIYGLSDRRGGVLPVISVDGWLLIMNSNPESDGIEFNYPDELIQFDEDMKPCHPWAECTVYRKDRTHAIRVREYLDEVVPACGDQEWQEVSWSLADLPEAYAPA